jgi:hypothetical protein
MDDWRRLRADGGDGAQRVRRRTTSSPEKLENEFPATKRDAVRLYTKLTTWGG